MIQKLDYDADTREQCIDLTNKVNELVDAVNGRRPPVARCAADQARMDLLISLVNGGPSLVPENEIRLVNELLDEGLVKIIDDGRWAITNAGRGWLTGR